MHECPNCGQACDCIGDDTWNSMESLECECQCEDFEDDMDDDYYEDDYMEPQVNTKPAPVPPLDLAFIRWSVVHRAWHELGGAMPSLEGFLAGWFCRVCEAEPPVMVSRFRDSFNCGWKEAHEQIVILSRQVDTNEELLAMLKRFASRGEQVWDDENFRDGYKKIPSGDIVDCRELLRQYGVENFND